MLTGSVPEDIAALRCYELFGISKLERAPPDVLVGFFVLYAGKATFSTMIRLLPLLFLLFLCTGVRAQNPSLEQRLRQLPGVTFEPGEMADYVSRYTLRIRQPLDHADTTKGFFQQRVYLTHLSDNQPTVLVTEGYAANRPAYYELSHLISANQVRVEHRFFGESLPDTLDFKYLNLTQATADYHHIRELLREIYPRDWVSTGISKGGATTIFYRYLYPDDVTVSVPYVAPINRAYEDTRLYDFQDTVGTDECRQRIAALQTRLLANREKVLPLLRFYSLGSGDAFTHVSLGEAFEYGVLEFPFAFWQGGGDCAAIPDEAASLEDAVAYFLAAAGISLFGDQLVEYYAAHYYQAATEMGYYGYRTSKFKDLLVDLPTDHNPMSLFFNFPMNDPFDGTLLSGVNKWLASDQANRMIYIYGANDTWTASAVPPNDKVDAEWFFLRGRSHSDARIRNMDQQEMVRLRTVLGKWLGVGFD